MSFAESLEEINQMIDNNQAVQALKIMEQMIKSNKNSAKHNFLLGKAYMECTQNREIGKIKALKYFKNSKKYLLSTCELDPNHLEARKMLINPLYFIPKLMGGNKKKALQLIEEIEIINNIEAEKCRIVIYKDEKEFDKAITACENCLKVNPEDIDIYYELAMIYQEQENWDKTFDIFIKGLTINPEHHESLYQFGRTAVFSQQHVAEGIRNIQKYLELDYKNGTPAKDAAHWRLGLLYKINGEINKARKELETAIALNPDNQYKKELKNL